MFDRLLRRSVSKAILSARYPQFADRLRSLGYEIIPSETVRDFISYEQDHADMQCLILDDTAFVLRCCSSLAKALKSAYNVVLCADGIGHDYPQNVPLNAAQVGKTIICRTDSLDDLVKEYCYSHDYELIHVRQGYAKCSCAVVSDNAIITADPGICKALQGTKIDVLKIGQGRIRLDGADYGFIGGASGYDKKNHTLYFTGDIRKHPDHERIDEFCRKHETEIISLGGDDLTDIGGIIIC